MQTQRMHFQIILAYLFLSSRRMSPRFYSQPSIRDARNVFHIGTEPESIDATCLPNLTRVAAMLSWLPYIIPGRLISEVAVFGDIWRSIDSSFFTLGTPPIQKLMLDYSYLHLKLGLLLASVFLSLTHFTMTTTRPGTFSKNQEVCWNFTLIYEILSTVVGWIRNWQLDWKHAHYLSLT
jgi:hypothetical protein